MRHIFVFLLFGFVAPMNVSILANASPLQTIVRKTERAPTIDGIVNDEEWEEAELIQAFTQIEPIPNGVASEKTEVRIMYNAEYLYFGIKCFDRDPSKIVANQMQREAEDTSDDLFLIALGSFGDKRNGYYFGISAGGDKRDGLIDSNASVKINTLWDTTWLGKSQVTLEGWSAEIAIPFRAISFHEGLPYWDFNLQRRIIKNKEIVQWSGKSSNEAFENLVNAGQLLGIKHITQGIGLKVEPYGLMNANLKDSRTSFRPGFTMAYSLTPSTTAQLTVNTDFAEAEVDQQVVNLSRFPTFFPEKRAFFLQDSTIFSFGGINQSPLPFYSRRIGIVRGQKKDVFAGLKVTGREGIVNFGFLDVQMYDDPDLGSKNLAVARVSANVFEESSAGVIVTHGDPGTTGNNFILGGDFSYKNSDIFGGQIIETGAWLMGSFSTEGPANANVGSGKNADDFAFAARAYYPNDTLTLNAFVGRYGENFNPALGFISRPGSWELYNSARYRWRFSGYLRRFDIEARANTYLNLDGSLQSLYLYPARVGLENNDGDIVDLHYGLTMENLSQPFDISPSVQIPTDNYLYHTVGAGLTTSRKRIVSGYIGINAGTYYNGIQIEPSISIDFRPSRHMLFGANYTYINRQLNEGLVEVHIASGKANFIFSPYLSWDNLIQYDSRSRDISINNTVRYEISPGQIAYLVFNHKINTDDTFSITSYEGQASVKLGMTLFF